ncbi:MAG: DUF4252 domain-containing protein [Bacteroidales bacterium]|nr:DUF4252 domain-containing protein [Bacteroidales bacterium]
MKRLIIILAVLLPAMLSAQKTPVDKLFEKYANQEGFTTVNISGKLLSLASKLGIEDDPAEEILSKLKAIRILTSDNLKNTEQINFYKELEKEGFFKNNAYDMLMEITEANEVVRFFSKENASGKISDLVLVVSGENNTLISIQGIIDPENIGKITKSLDINIGN